jgi:pyruvate,orthophosphate dikinase
VVAGIRTPEPISKLKDALPLAYEELMKNVNLLEAYYHDMQVLSNEPHSLSPSCE